MGAFRDLQVVEDVRCNFSVTDTYGQQDQYGPVEPLVLVDKGCEDVFIFASRLVGGSRSRGELNDKCLRSAWSVEVS